MSDIVCQTSNDVYQTSDVVCQMSDILCQTSDDVYQTFDVV